MKFWYIVEERSEYNYERKEIGASISAKIVDVLPRKTDGHFEWHNTESVEDGIYVLRRWCRTKKDAISAIKIHMDYTPSRAANPGGKET